ncbi:hypothetical protein HCB69_12010 [Listeria booriae]|uniref:Uncharacterized protein n=1 Tax=Listeria booriae TaxID=1552123 RepID=A0A842GBS9_9LIST|nr:hypothetical protein [Listeria booriae]MBC2285104.1 hypothetical protein [Listeria booriae]MBC2294532.1 hypothetical protein [Listeria booriae]
MKKGYYIILGVVVIVLLSLGVQNRIVNAEMNNDEPIRVLYQEAVEKGKVNSEKYTFEAFKENYSLAENEYQTLKNIIGQDLKFEQWFADIANYGAFPDGEGHSPSEKKTNNLLQASQTSNGNKLKNTIRKGDILIISSGGFGHAAIATSDTYILEMSGGGDNPAKWFAGGISDNNHQFSKDKWIFGGSEQGATSARHIKDWIQLWRVPDNSMAIKCANYADATFWNSGHGYTKNRHIAYRLTAATTTLNPNYCSKLVFQSFYYGSGNATVIQPSMAGLSFVSPGALPNLFAGKYAPYKVGTF